MTPRGLLWEGGAVWSCRPSLGISGHLWASLGVSGNLRAPQGRERDVRRARIARNPVSSVEKSWINPQIFKGWSPFDRGNPALKPDLHALAGQKLV
jgi:hypothetical protein